MNNEQGFTPGPWNMGRVRENVDVLNRSKTLRAVAECIRDAAPELLEALQYVKGCLDESREQGYPVNVEFLTLAVEAAIAKARGTA